MAVCEYFFSMDKSKFLMSGEDLMCVGKEINNSYNKSNILNGAHIISGLNSIAFVLISCTDSVITIMFLFLFHDFFWSLFSGWW